MKQKTTHFSRREIKKLIDEGKSLSFIAEKMNVDVPVASRIVEDLLEKKYREIRQEAILRDLEEVKNRKRDINEVRMNFGYTPLGFYLYVEKAGFLSLLKTADSKEITSKEIARTRSMLLENKKGSIDALIDEGLPFSDIAKSSGNNRQFVTGYVYGSGQYAYWNQRQQIRKKKDERDNQELTKTRQNLVNSILEKLVYQRQQIPASATVKEKVDLYFTKYQLLHSDGKGNQPNTKRLKKLLKLYFTAETSREKRSLRAIAIEAGFINPPGAINFIRQLKLPCEIGNYIQIGPREKELIQRARNTPFTAPDVKYFARIESSSCTVVAHLGKRKKKLHFDGENPFPQGSYRLMSQIYQAQDLGFNRKELNTLFPETRDSFIDNIIAQRARVSKIITSGLKEIYPDMGLNTPYLP